MKFSKTISFMFIAPIFLFGACSNSRQNDEKVSKKPVKKVYITKRSPLTTVVDTIYITKENYEYHRLRGAAGTYIPATNTVKVNYYFPTDSSDTKIKVFCDRNNQGMRLTIRHETEHAKKAFLTRNKMVRSPFVNAQLAVMNEIMARAAEIIEIMDYHYETGTVYPVGRFNAKEIDSLITDIANRDNLRWPLYFSYQPIADIILTQALDAFVGTYNRGYYKTTIKKRFEKENSANYFPANQYEKHEFAGFIPEFNKWGPMFKFKSYSGVHDIYTNASPVVRQTFLNTVDSIVFDAINAGKNDMFYKKYILR